LIALNQLEKYNVNNSCDFESHLLEESSKNDNFVKKSKNGDFVKFEDIKKLINKIKK
jgi:hypothetical protein